MEPLFQQYPSMHRESTGSQSGLGFFIAYINFLEGVKTKIKNLHWAARKLPVNGKRGAHIYLDDFLDIVSDFQDTIAETSQGIHGHMGLNDIQGTPIEALCPGELIKVIMERTIPFYENIPTETIYVGIKSETETFIKDLNKYKYLFELTE